MAASWLPETRRGLPSSGAVGAGSEVAAEVDVGVGVGVGVGSVIELPPPVLGGGSGHEVAVALELMDLNCG
jgi:hypothetical protein